MTTRAAMVRAAQASAMAASRRPGVAQTRVRIKGTRVYVAAPEPAFDAAGTGRRLRNWVATGGSINSILSGALDDLRARSRDTGRKVPWVANAIETVSANIVGTGIVPSFMAPDPTWRALIQQAWDDWTDEADFDGVTDFYGLQRIVSRGVVESGETLARLHEDVEGDLLVPFQVQLLEPDHMPVSETKPIGFVAGGGFVMNGVQFDAKGKRSGYWLWPNHPGEFTLRTDRTILELHAARDLLHVYRVDRAGQVRGYPWVAAALLRIRDMGEYEDAELVRKKFAAMFSAFLITSAEAPDDILAANTLLDASGKVVRSEAVLEPGTTQVLQPGEDLRFSEPADVGPNYEPYMRVNLRAEAAAFGLTPEQYTGDLSGVSFSGIRAGLNEAQRRFEPWQHQIVAHQFSRPIKDRFIRAAIMNGVVPVPEGYAENWRPWHRVAWMPQGWRYVNPLQEEAAEQMQLRSGRISRRKSVAKNGYSIEQLDQEIADDNRRADGLGLVFDSDPRRTAGSGAAQADPRQSPDDPASDAPPAPPRRDVPAGSARVIPIRRR
ncbi:MAG: phage portal protein [Alphaproteobacteria bacterium]